MFFNGFGNGFPYTNFHELNMDWIISEIAKFRHDYEHIQEAVNNGVLVIDNKTAEDLARLNDEFTRLENAITEEVDESFATFSAQVIAEANRVIATIPQDYTALSRTPSTYILISTAQVITYNYSSKVLTFPSGVFCVYNGVPHAIPSSISIDLTDHLLADACNLWMLSDYSIIAEQFDTTPLDTSARYLGSVYNKNIHINGVPSEFVKIIYSGTYQEPFYPDNKGSYIGIEEQTRTIIINFDAKTIYFPGGFKVYRGTSIAYANETVSFTSGMANKIWMRRDHSIYTTEWNVSVPEHSDDDCIGFFYYETAWIAGVPKNCFEIIPASHKGDVYVFGDSIPAGTATTRNFTMYMHDFDRKIRFLNYAVGGTGFYVDYSGTAVAGNGTEANGVSGTQSGNNNVYKQINAVSATIPAIVIASGTNDWSGNVTIANFRTAVQNALNLALTKTSKVFVLLPIKRENWNTATNTQNLKLKDYNDVIKEECVARAIPYYDGFDIFLDPSVASNKTNFVPDGLHPNDNGHRRIARAVYDTVLQTICYY